MASKSSRERTTANETLAREYFKLLAAKDVDNLLNLFAHDAVVYEPFSKSDGLRGRSAIEPFLRVVMMATENVKQGVVIEKTRSKNAVTAIATFEKGDMVKGRYTFEFTDRNAGPRERKIKTLRIKFI